MPQTQTRYQDHETPTTDGAETVEGLSMELAIESLPLSGLNRRIERTRGRDSILNDQHKTLMLRIDHLLDRMLEHLPPTLSLEPAIPAEAHPTV